MHQCGDEVLAKYSAHLVKQDSISQLAPSKKTYRILSRITKNLIRTSFLIRKRVRNNKRRKILKPYKIPTRSYKKRIGTCKNYLRTKQDLIKARHSKCDA